MDTETNMQTYMVQAIQGRNGRFEDFIVEAVDEVAAVCAARELAQDAGFDLRWTDFVL